MIHTILVQLKTDAAAWLTGTGILAVIGLLANPVTSPKVFAVLIFITDWHFIWTLDWWVRTSASLAVGIGLWLIQRRRNGKQLLAQEARLEAHWKEQTKELREELRHTQQMLAGSQTRIAVLERR